MVHATRFIPAGTSLTHTYSSGSNDQMLLDYGFVPHVNSYDFITLAEDPYGVAMLYLKGVDVGEAEGGVTNSRAIQWMEGVVRSVDEKVAELKASILEERVYKFYSHAEQEDDEFDNPDVELERAQYATGVHEPFAVWVNGIIDPRLLASIAAIWHYSEFGAGDTSKVKFRK